jgi:battenin
MRWIGIVSPQKAASSMTWFDRLPTSVNVFYRVNQEQPDPSSSHDPELVKQEREFKIGSIGFADSSGILLASILAVPTEVGLCRAQVARGKYLCQGL